MNAKKKIDIYLKFERKKESKKESFSVVQCSDKEQA